MKKSRTAKKRTQIMSTFGDKLIVSVGSTSAFSGKADIGADARYWG
jgi:hypothetical protein